MIEKAPMQKFSLENDNGPEVEFTGELLARASSQRRNSYRWSEMDLYRTQGGKYVVHVIGETEVEGESTRYDVYIYPSKEEMMRSIRYSSLTAKLFENAGFAAIQID